MRIANMFAAKIHPGDGGNPAVVRLADDITQGPRHFGFVFAADINGIADGRRAQFYGFGDGADQRRKRLLAPVKCSLAVELDD